MDYGPVIGASYGFEAIDRQVERGLSIRFPGRGVAVFDTDLLTYTMVTLDGEVDLSNTDFMREKGGQGLPTVTGEPFMYTGEGTGVSDDGDWADPRPDKAGPMPGVHGRFNGYYKHGDRVVLSYSLGEALVLDHPWVLQKNGQTGIVRSIRVEGLQKTRQFRLLDQNEDAQVNRGSNWCLIKRETDQIGIAIFGAPGRTSLVLDEEGPVSVNVAKGGDAASFHVVIARFEAGVEDAESGLSRLATAAEDEPDPRTLVGGGPASWDQTLTREGTPSEKNSAYVNDEIPVPEDNPWNAFIRITGLDFFNDGRAAVCTLNGDVWIVSGLDQELEDVRWKRFATGLYNPLGLSVRGETVFVLEQGQITELNDLNSDGEADFYKRFNGDGPLVPNAYWMGLEHDSEGRFYYLRSGHRAQGSEHQDAYGSLIQVSENGSSSTTYAYGFRQTGGLGIGPDNQIQTTDQEGNWVPATRIDRVMEGKFYGYQPNAPEGTSEGDGTMSFTRPISWLPMGADNSAGDELYADTDQWGPLGGHWIHLSWGMARMFVELHETVNGQLQGGVVRIPLDRFKAGLLRGAVGPHDGQVYVAGPGVPGWTSVSSTLNTFNRVRYTGKPVHLPVQLKTSKSGVTLTFAGTLDREEASKIENYTVKRWTYRYSSNYGSPPYSLENPGEEGRDPMKVETVNVSPDGTEVSLDIADMKPVRQMSVSYELKTEKGDPITNRVLFTIHELAE
jgi:hypothetical protein